jgi:transcription elongation factor Elf1
VNTKEKKMTKNFNFKYDECPYCKSTAISAYELDRDGSVFNNSVECNDCENRWQECYELTSRFDNNGVLIDTFKTYENKGE